MPRAILYGRVSNVSQHERGLSLPSQFGELRAWCADNGYDVVGEVADRGGVGSKRSDLDRPGLDELYDTAERLSLAAGDVVVAQSWDRLGEDDVPAWIGRRLATVSGARLRTPDDPNDAEDEGAVLLRMVNRWNAGRERRQTARRTRSRKVELARSGYVVPSHTATYGFRYSGERKQRTYEVDEERAAVVRRIFEAIAGGTGVRTLVRELDADGVPTPPGAKRPGAGGWNRQFIRHLIRNDVYMPHTAEELAALVADGKLRADVPAEPDCGVWYYRGADYAGERHEVAVPVANVNIPRETVDEARRRLASNRPASSASGRYWSLSRGMLTCGSCGRNMATHSVKKPTEKTHRYYRCQSTSDTLKGQCDNPVFVPAERAERAVWRLVCELEASPRNVLDAIDATIEDERNRLRVDPGDELREIARLADELATRRANFQMQHANELMTLNELRVQLDGIEEERAILERRAASVKTGGARLAKLEEIRETYTHLDGDAREYLAGIYTGEFAERLEQTPPEEQRKCFEGLGLTAKTLARDELEVSGVFGTDTVVIDEPWRRPDAR